MRVVATNRGPSTSPETVDPAPERSERARADVMQQTGKIIKV